MSTARGFRKREMSSNDFLERQKRANEWPCVVQIGAHSKACSGGSHPKLPETNILLTNFSATCAGRLRNWEIHSPKANATCEAKGAERMPVEGQTGNLPLLAVLKSRQKALDDLPAWMPTPTWRRSPLRGTVSVKPWKSTGNSTSPGVNNMARGSPAPAVLFARTVLDVVSSRSALPRQAVVGTILMN